MIFFAIIAFILVLINTIIYIQNTKRKKQEEKIIKEEDDIREQILGWCTNSFQLKKYDKSNLVSPAKMKNGEINLDGLEIKVTEYTKN